MKFDLIRRSLMWLAGMALPATPLLQRRLQCAMRGIAFAISGATILSGLFIALVCAAYFYLVSVGVEPVIAFGILAALAFVSGSALILLAMRDIRTASYIKDDLSLLPKASDIGDPLRHLVEQFAGFPLAAAGKTGNSVRDIAGAFVDGLLNGRPDDKPRTPAVASEPAGPASRFEIHAVDRVDGKEFHVEHGRRDPRDDAAFL